MSPHISTQSDKINEGYCAIGGVHIRCFSAEQQLPNHSLRLPYNFLVGVKFISREEPVGMRCYWRAM